MSTHLRMHVHQGVLSAVLATYFPVAVLDSRRSHVEAKEHHQASRATLVASRQRLESKSNSAKGTRSSCHPLSQPCTSRTRRISDPQRFLGRSPRSATLPPRFQDPSRSASSSRRSRKSRFIETCLRLTNAQANFSFFPGAGFPFTSGFPVTIIIVMTERSCLNGFLWGITKSGAQTKSSTTVFYQVPWCKANTSTPSPCS